MTETEVREAIAADLDAERKTRLAGATDVIEQTWINAAFTAAIRVVRSGPTPPPPPKDYGPPTERTGRDLAYKD